jgi:hypothetical protein
MSSRPATVDGNLFMVLHLISIDGDVASVAWQRRTAVAAAPRRPGMTKF